METMWWKRITSEVRILIEGQGGFWEIPWQLAALMEELGELSRVLQEHQGIRSREDEFTRDWEDALKLELGDLFFALICLAMSLNVDLLEALDLTIQKYADRATSRRQGKT